VRIQKFTWESKFVEDKSVEKIIAKLKESKFCVEEEGALKLELNSFGIAGRETKWVFARSDGLPCTLPGISHITWTSSRELTSRSTSSERTTS